jgi:DNA polymerase
MNGEKIPSEIISLLFDPSCIKYAYNAAFEWYCLSKHFKLKELNDWLPQWRCTMLHGLYCGYTAGLAATGEALGLPMDKRKMQAGARLIDVFCKPCKPTRSNGYCSRTLPHHEPEKWELFKEYCRQDVVTEMEIERRLSFYPVLDTIQRQWSTDQIINSRGVAVDLDFVRGAIWCSETITEKLMKEAISLSGLENPKSVSQLSKWLEEETGLEIGNLRKDTVNSLLERDLISKKARRLLEIRQGLGKSSVAKYSAMEAAVCEDGRLRGMLQFYGANRTGRWAGRIVQPQNLPQTHLSALPLARDLVKRGDLEMLELLYGNVPDALSQLIRTALVAPPGYVLLDADFSAIEARVIAWLAGEEWVLEVFRTHGKIYEACAAHMFGVPIEKIVKGNPEYELRQKGKIATLALGYQGSTGALIAMGALQQGLTEEELPEIVSRWRQANSRIVDLWYSVENVAVETIRTGLPNGINGLIFAMEGDSSGQYFMTITLPSGRKLYYVKPFLVPNSRGYASIRYWGVNQGKWRKIETYGGKLVENIVQAIARDCLAVNIERLEAAGFPVVFHVHDEIVIEVPEDKANLDRVTAIMSQPIDWAPGLPLKADGWVDVFYKKD